MSDAKRTCETCGGPIPAAGPVHEVVINAHRLEPEIRAAVCPRCARGIVRQRRFGAVEVWALEAAADVLKPLLGGPVKVTWLQGDEHTWRVLARFRKRFGAADSSGGP